MVCRDPFQVSRCALATILSQILPRPKKWGWPFPDRGNCLLVARKLRGGKAGA